MKEAGSSNLAPTKSRIPRAASWSFFFALIVSGVLFLFYLHPQLMQRYTIESPREPRPETGQVTPFNQHGVVIYFSSSQQRNLLLLQALGVIQLLAAGAAWRFLSKSQHQVTGNGA
jgi:hypothetical protein